MQIDSSQNYPSSSLYRFFEPVKLALESYVQDCGHSASQLEPIIKCSIEEAIKSNSSAPKTLMPRILRQKIESSSKVYIDAVLSQTKTWQSCRERIKAYSSIFLIGAGLSYSSDMPLANILNDVLNFCGVSNWDELRRDSSKFLNFKKQFKTLCDRKSPSNGHKLIITNFPQYIYEIICLNWDDLFEKAANVIGVLINKQNEDKPTTSERYLWKFHGDVENIKDDNIKGQGGWVLPDEDGFVFDSFQEYVSRAQLKEKLFTFVIIGYNEGEEVIYQQIISLLEKAPPRPTYRIGLDLKNLRKDNHIVGTAEFILNKILPTSSVKAS
jgi:hypothetical protein